MTFSLGDFMVYRSRIVQVVADRHDPLPLIFTVVNLITLERHVCNYDELSEVQEPHIELLINTLKDLLADQMIRNK